MSGGHGQLSGSPEGDGGQLRNQQLCFAYELGQRRCAMRLAVGAVLALMWLVCAPACGKSKEEARIFDAVPAPPPPAPAPNVVACTLSSEELPQMISHAAALETEEKWQELFDCVPRYREHEADSLLLMSYPHLVVGAAKVGNLELARELFGVLDAGLRGTDEEPALVHVLTKAAVKMADGELGAALALNCANQADNGTFDGSIDMERVVAIRSGNVSKGKLVGLAGKKGRRGGARKSFRSQEDRLIATTMGYLGAEGFAKQFHMVLRSDGLGQRSFLISVLRKHRVSKSTAETIVATMEKLLPPVKKRKDPEIQWPDYVLKNAYTTRTFATLLAGMEARLEDAALSKAVAELKAAL